MTAAKDVENYQLYTNIPNTIEVAFCFDMQSGVDPTPAPKNGVLGARRNAAVERVQGFNVIYLQDIFDDAYYTQSQQPVTVDSPDTHNIPNTMKIQHIQFSLTDYLSGPALGTPRDIYALVWYWNPEEFPTEMTDVNDSIKNRIVVGMYDKNTDELITTPLPIRGNMVVTLRDTYENARLIPKGAYV